MCKIAKIIYLEQVTVFVKSIELNPTCFVGYILPEGIAMVLFDVISPGYGGLGLEGHDLSTICREGILLSKSFP